MQEPIRVLFLNRSFEQGGAERQLVALLKGIDKMRFSVSVVTFYERGNLIEEVQKIDGVDLEFLGKCGRWDITGFAMKLARTMRRCQPHIVHGYLDLANILALLFGRLVRAKIVWGVRASNVDLRQYDWLWKCAFAGSRYLARFADAIIVNSEAGRSYHRRQGYPESRMEVISNGIDVDAFTPASAEGRRVRSDWKISEDEKLIGLAARIDPMKDYPNFLRAAARVAATVKGVRFVAVGGGSDAEIQRLARLVGDLNLGDRMIWAGQRMDMKAVYNAMDIACLTSAFGEGFPNVIAEAMACGVPCVVTDVGDSRQIVGDTGEVVPPEEPQALAAGICRMLERLVEEPDLRIRARERIVERFSLEEMIKRTERALERLVRAV